MYLTLKKALPDAKASPMDIESLPVLYSFRRCPYAMRARLALGSAQQSCQWREVLLRDKPQALLDASPKGTVPVLVLPDGTVIDESLDIMLWALRQYDPHRWLTPEHGTLDQMLSLIAENDGRFKEHLDRYKYPVRFDLDSGLDDRDKGAVWLHRLSERLADSPYLFGSRPTLADMAIAPFVRQYAHTDRDWFWAQDWPALCRWLDAFLKNPLFTGIMQKVARWTPNQTPVMFPPAGLASGHAGHDA